MELKKVTKSLIYISEKIIVKLNNFQTMVLNIYRCNEERTF